MDSIKVKNFIIVVLLIVNTVLLSVFAADTVREKSMDSSAVEGAVAILAQNGITVAEDVDLSERQIVSMLVTRDTQLEESMAANVLGSVSVRDQGGNILLYFGPRGEASFRGTGSVEMNLHAGEYTATDPVEAARSFARELGLDTVREPVSNNVDAETLEGTLELCCSCNGVRVVNCTLSFTFAGGELLGVYGTRLLDNATQGQRASSIDVPTVLMRFLQIVLDRGRICSSLNALELCYSMTANAAGEGELVPIWRIETDTGEFYINAMTGLEEPVS